MQSFTQIKSETISVKSHREREEPYLLGSDEFVVAELGELRTQREVAVHEERLTALLIQVREGQACKISE